MEEIDTLLNELTLVEKAQLLAGADVWRTVPIERLGIEAVQVSDGPNGVRGRDDNLGDTTVCFPVGVAIGATWNPEMVWQVGAALAAEVRRRGADVLLAPTVNIPRSPLAGRNFECYSEDPFLSGSIAAAYVNGLQDNGVGACIKHFVANDQETERFSISSEVAERPLYEIYLEPFRLAVQHANPWTIMSSYNRINGTHASENVLLHEVLKGRWQYDGAVISDWYGTYSDNVRAGGLDLEMPGPARWMDAAKVVADVESGALDEATVDDKVRRLLRLMQRVGKLAGSAPRTPATPEDNLARRAAAESIVLLKNDGDLLPLNPQQPLKIAVIGENARWASIMGGGSAQVNPHYTIAPLEGITARAAADGAVHYALGTPIHRRPPSLNLDWLRAEDGVTPGLTLRYYDNLTLSGTPSTTDIVRKTELHWFGEANPYVDPANFSLRLSGSLRVPTSGEYRLQLMTYGGGRVLLDGRVVLDTWAGEEGSERVDEVVLPFDSATPARLTVEYVTDQNSRGRWLRLGCTPVLAADPIQAAADLAARCDVAIVVAGLTREWETEGLDRPDMRLVGQQDELIARVAAANPNTIVVLNVGSPVEMPWVDAVPAVLQQWYGGQDAGHGLADVLFGVVNPSGRLPVTIPRRVQDNPAYLNFPGENGKVYYGEGIYVGYRYYDAKAIDPLFPFGHGLSYSTFAYDNLRVTVGTDSIIVQVDVTNTGTIAGAEVVQLYLHAPAARLARPPQELKAFARVAPEPGQMQTATMTLSPQSLACYDPAAGSWIAEPGDYELRVGSSSRDIRLRQTFRWGTPEQELAHSANSGYLVQQ